MSEPVNIKILDREFTIGCEPDEREGLLAAARLLDARMREVRGNNRMAGIDRIAVLVALNLAHELQNVQKDTGQHDQEFSRALGDLNRKLDGLVDNLASR